MKIDMDWFKSLPTAWKMFAAGSACTSLPVVWNYGLDNGLLVSGLLFLGAAFISAIGSSS